MEIGSADPARLHGDQSLHRPRHRVGNVVDTEVPVPGHGCTHVPDTTGVIRVEL
jgi:hypothetical protein